MDYKRFYKVGDVVAHAVRFSSYELIHYVGRITKLDDDRLEFKTRNGSTVVCMHNNPVNLSAIEKESEHFKYKL